MEDKYVKKIHREIRFGNYILGSTLGEGEFGKVKLGWRKDGKLPQQVAIKLIKRDTLVKDLELEIKIHREINSLKILNHPNIINLVEVMKSGKYIGIVLEYASGGELFDYILHHKYLKEPVAKKFFAQLVSGVDYMHSKGLIHRDLKLENLLLDKNKNIIITDFGFVNSFNVGHNNDLMKTSCGSPCYAAPELVLTPNPYEGKKVDIWSLGIILYAMLAGYLPFDDDPSNEDGNDIIKLYHYICKTPLTFPEYVSPLARDLLRKIIVSDPKKRININEIRNHAWLSSHANLLSIRQPEWDKIYRDKQQKSPPVPLASSAAAAKSKRFSMINEPTNSSQLNYSSFRKQHGRSTSTSTTLPFDDTANSFKISTIVELPKRPPLQTVDDFSSSTVTTSKPVTGLTMNANTKLPQPKKPRPTSYHPLSYSYDTKPPSPISIPQLLTNVSPKNSPPKEERRNLVVTPINVNGVFGSDYVDKRSSVLIYLEDKMSTLDLEPPKEKEVKEQEQEPESEPENKDDNKENKIKEPKSIRTRDTSDDARKKRFSILSIYSNNTVTRSGSIRGELDANSYKKKEMSAAKKVMDFFKRRSVRVN